ncbi:bifunctional biotin--[acetyl-CoA-carboxylase] ligase/biotin operon repressor BirA [Pantoea sp. Mhis]|uniref:bifunctional biotin--[acetyl-CoA-carboxylase] ligase/biotin operon repressor BirA n=1 Tax=Pantoea sp. Mhis TaxID=2576759 RepID=UPI00135AF5BF|nr:bifunctional biotin--[acetyl-CoA-carboxylase] ligase/biotin operon repressor BirA [Pantoea sp. Mhis]MXP56509.1 bifunctional biotin--[acetyl-CoA-carboxylase] ligase/biotin operon repressor BirA [Pantoea sp. Mhis]
MNNDNIALDLISLLSDGNYHSDNELKIMLNINQNNINKYILILKSWGLDLHTLDGKGYSLFKPLQLLNEKYILSHLNQPKLSILSLTDSTNQYLLDRVNYLLSGDACIAEYQQSGRGRRGRTWYSPFAANLYLSVHWYFKHGLMSTTGLSLAVGVIIAELIQSLGVVDIRVKWPNDLYLYERKLGGILIECIRNLDDSARVIIGIGMNLFMKNKHFLQMDINAANLEESGTKINRNELAVKIINNLREILPIFERDGLNPFIQRWLCLDNFINRSVKLVIENREIYGIERGIDKVGNLLLEQNKKIKSWVSGDLSLELNY